jgi:hypothetical protein
LRFTTWRWLALVPALLAAGACGSGNGSGSRHDAAVISHDAATTSTAASPDAAGAALPLASTPAPSGQAGRDAAIEASLTYNLNITKQVRASLQRRMGDLPERLYAFGQRHGGTEVYETLAGGGIHATPGNLTQMEQGTTKNVIVSLPDRHVFLRYVIGPDGSRQVTGLQFEAPGPDGHPPHRLDITLFEIGDLTRNWFRSGYFDADSYETQGANGTTELTGVSETTVQPPQVEVLLNKLDFILTG